MRSFDANFIQREAYVIVPVEHDQILANALNALCNMAHFAAFEPNISNASYSHMLTNTYQPIDEWAKELTSKTAVTAGAVSAARSENTVTDMLLLDWVKDSNILAILGDAIRTWLAELSRPRTAREDWGACLRQDLREMSFQDAWGVLPATGYQRPYTVPMWVDKLPGADKCWEVPHPISDITTKIAHILARIDAWRFSTDLFRIPLDIASKSRLDKLYGAHDSLEWMARRTQAFGAMYRMAAMRLVYGLHKRIRAVSLAHYNHRAIRPRNDLTELVDDAERMFLDLPEHPLGQYLSSVLETGTIMTQFGLHEAIFVQSAIPESWLTVGKDPCSLPVSALGQSYATHLRSVSRVQGGAGDPCLMRGWGVPLAAHAQYAKSSITLLELMTSVRADPELEPLVKELSRAMGWGSLTGRLGEISANGSDFLLTDGIGCSGEPDQATLGITPTLSLGNIRATGIYKRIAGIGEGPGSAWTPWDQRIYCIPLNGRIDALQGKHLLERKMLPLSMCMEEPDWKPLLGAMLAREDILSDDLILSMTEHFETEISSYIRENYGPIVTKNASPDAFQSSWDPVALGNDPALVKAAWIALISSQAVAAKGMNYMTRRTGSPFYGRTLTRLAMNVGEKGVPYYFVLNELGIAKSKNRFPFKSAVVFDNSVSCTHDFASMDKLLILAPISKAVQVTSASAAELVKKFTESEAGV